MCRRHVAMHRRRCQGIIVHRRRCTLSPALRVRWCRHTLLPSCAMLLAMVVVVHWPSVGRHGVSQLQSASCAWARGRWRWGVLLVPSNRRGVSVLAAGGSWHAGVLSICVARLCATPEPLGLVDSVVGGCSWCPPPLTAVVVAVARRRPLVGRGPITHKLGV